MDCESSDDDLAIKMMALNSKIARGSKSTTKAGRVAAKKSPKAKASHSSDKKKAAAPTKKNPTTKTNKVVPVEKALTSKKNKVDPIKNPTTKHVTSAAGKENVAPVLFPELPAPADTGPPDMTVPLPLAASGVVQESTSYIPGGGGVTFSDITNEAITNIVTNYVYMG
jgi:hypothetical protein